MPSGKRILADLRLFGRGYIRNAAGLFFGLIFPVVLILIFGAIFAENTGAVTVYVQNQDSGPISDSFLGALNNVTRLKVEMVDPSQNFTQYLSAHSSSDGIIIPEDFSASYLAGMPVNLTVYGNPSQTSSAIISGAVDGLADYFNLKYYNQNAFPVIGIDPANLRAGEPKYIDFLVPGLIGFSILVSPMFSMVSISSEYKKHKLFKQMSLTPLTKLEWLASKVLFYVLLSAFSFLLMVAVGVFVFGANITLSVWLIPFLILGPMLFCSLGMLVGTVTKSIESASVLGNIITFPMMFLSGTFFPISMMPEYLRTVAHGLPLFYVIEGLNNVMTYDNITSALIDIAVVTVITVIVFLAAAKLFKWRED